MNNPINQNYNSRLIIRIPSILIIEKYRKDFQIDVSQYFYNVDFVELYKCDVTKYRFYYPFSIMGDSDFYQLLSNGNSNYYHIRWEHLLAIKYAKKGECWLEVGSGNSNFLRELSNVGVSSIGLELNKEEVIKAKSENLNVFSSDFFSYKFDNIHFDTIASFQVLEHLKDVSLFFSKARNLLKPKGKLIIGVPNNNPYLYVFDVFHTLNLPPHHMGLWNGDSLKNVGKEYGFIVKDIQYEPISEYELNYILNKFSFKNISFSNFKFLVLKLIRKIFPSRVFSFVSIFYRKILVKGRNVVIVLEKYDRI